MLIHCCSQIQLRVDTLNSVTSRLTNFNIDVLQSTQRAWYEYFMIPTALYVYSNCTVLQMEYGELGTLITALQVFTKQRGQYSTAEHEYLVAYLSLQVSIC